MKEKEKFVLLGKGNERYCYIHPNDSSKVIKVTYKNNGRKQNDLEYKYYQYLEKKNVSFKHIPQCYGWIVLNGNKKGLVFQRIQNGQTFNYLLKNKEITCDDAKEILEQLRHYLFSNEILFIDISFDNIMCVKQGEKYFPYIIDGLGGRRAKWKFYLYQYIGFYRRYKIKKQWQKMMQMFQTLCLELQ